LVGGNEVGLFLLVFLTVALGIAAGFQALSGFLFPEAEHIRRRIAEEFGKDSQAPQSELFKNIDQLTLESRTELVDPEQVEAASPAQPARGLREGLQALLDGANVPLTPQQVLLIVACLGLVFGTGGFFLGGLWLAVPAMLAAAVLPLVILRHKKEARRNTYLKQLPGAFELMARVIRAGQSVPQAFQAVAEAMEEPVAVEFAKCQKQQNLGLRPEVSFQEMAERSGILEMRIFAMAMLIQRQTGGNLSDVLDRLAGLVRARLRLRERVRTLTAEGRLQGWTLVVLPFIAFGVMMVANRKYAEVLFDHVPLLLGMGIAMLVGIFWIRRIIDIDL
jgi:tight adherence protein B